MKTAICIGHSRRIEGRIEGGAIAYDGLTSEWQYNTRLGRDICSRLESWGIDAILIQDYGEHGSRPGAYRRAMESLAAELKHLEVGLAVELHFNAYDRRANGHEVLYWKGSATGEAMAKHIEARLSTIDKLAKRGTKPKEGGRGSEFLQKTHCPANIVESFFGDSPTDWAYARDNYKRIALEIAKGIAATVAAAKAK